jgi:phenylacetate-CoA ligase
MTNPAYRFNDFDPPVPFLTGDASVLHSIITEVERVNYLSPEDIQKRQAAFLYKLISHFSRKSFKFSKRLHGRISSHSEDTPLLDLLDLFQPLDKHYFQKLSSEEAKVPKHHLPTHWATTSGSTGVPLKVQCTSITRAIGMASVPWAHLASGTDFSWRMASVKPTNLITGESDSWDPASSLLFDVGPMLSVSSSEDVFTQLDQLEKFEPDCLIVFPSVLNEYASIWERGLREPPKFKAIRTMGETLRDETRHLVEKVTGAPVLDTYSSSEVGRIATQIAPHSPYTVNNYSLVVEVLNEVGERCAPGEIGRVVITDLFNYATPLVRYDIGDWAIPADTYHHKLEKVMGRSRNMLTLPDGRKVWPLVGYREFSEVVPVRQFHIQQTSVDSLRARFFVDYLPCLEQREKLKRIVRESMGYDFNIEDLYQTEPFEKKPNGKMEDFVSLL